MDDVAVYNKALTPLQIQTHFENTVRLTVTRSGNNVVLSWPFGTLESAPPSPAPTPTCPAQRPRTQRAQPSEDLLSREGPVITPAGLDYDVRR